MHLQCNIPPARVYESSHSSFTCCSSKSFPEVSRKISPSAVSVLDSRKCKRLHEATSPGKTMQSSVSSWQVRVNACSVIGGSYKLCFIISSGEMGLKMDEHMNRYISDVLLEWWCSLFHIFLLSTNKNINNLYCFTGNTHNLCSLKIHHLLCNSLWVWHHTFVAVYQPRVCQSGVIILLVLGPGAAIFRWICSAMYPSWLVPVLTMIWIFIAKLSKLWLSIIYCPVLAADSRWIHLCPQCPRLY